jgi:hypothetical protein
VSAAPTDDIRSRIDAIEEAYEFFLAYAAQGASGDGASKSGGQLRLFLGKAASAMDGLAGSVGAAARGMHPADVWTDVCAVVDGDARAALAAVRLVAAQPSISSQLVDNLNANMHLRAVLTDLFLVDELLG